jgi:hypothetical protein
MLGGGRFLPDWFHLEKNELLSGKEASKLKRKTAKP